MRIFLWFAVVLQFAMITIASAQTAEQIQQAQQQLQQRGANNNAANAQGMTGNQPMQLSPIPGLSGTSQTGTRPSNGQYTNKPRNGLVLPGEPTMEMVFPLQETMDNPPFAANLFVGGFESERANAINENYLVAPGDQISIWMWGAVDYSDVATVDSQGNIFIPKLGPINLLNVPASNVNQVVTQTIKQVYTNDVNVYVNLLTATPVSVYVSGPVLRPGQYAGQATDSPLYFLKRAGGIDFLRGSFRQIDLIRNGKVIESFDLYDFITNGEIPTVSFQDRDVLLIHPIGPTITVSEGARNSFTFELMPEDLSGNALVDYARPGDFISHVSISGLRDGAHFARYTSLNNFGNFVLKSGDHVEFKNDHEQQVYPINITGSFRGASRVMVSKGARLHQVLSNIEVDPALANFKSVYILRESVAEQQQMIIDQALDRLERSVYTAPVRSTGEGSIRVQEAQLVSDFVARARQIKPLGKVIIADKSSVANILLEENDTIVIPAKTDLVHVGGEVLMPQSVVFNPDAKITDYVAWAGGFSERANDERILVIRANGMVDFYDASDDSDIAAGDQVIVLPQIDAKTLQAVKDITQIIYQIAVAANVAIN
ncbi:polysaccharide biosynthesis/export family protein [Alteromonas gilva]|uniref:Polysaccharide biosynthesis/export family protein n=1 Tax=Alteromonas gilva TaxID=2987522 RepID=A0ABT5L6K2_9ALTE|nr:polysaccharide biosynthesis/export family protein [Alteromonas gilva]MDC8832677.1 polysaccharide biosynthesis/export family protein [Alteromonas gilva]